MIGTGKRGQDLLEEVLTVPNIQLAAMADVYSRRRDAVKKKVFGIQTFNDHRRLLDMKDLTRSSLPAPCTRTLDIFSTLWRRGKIFTPRRL
jgi:hypothetical protein